MRNCQIRYALKVKKSNPILYSTSLILQHFTTFLKKARLFTKEEANRMVKLFPELETAKVIVTFKEIQE